MVPDKEDAVHNHVSDTSPLPSERGQETSIIFEYEVSVFRDVEAAVTATPDSGLDIGDMGVEHNETEDEEERIAWFLKRWVLVQAARLHTILHSVIASMI